MQAAVSDRMALVITVLALIGMVLSVVSLINHYKTTPSDFCDLDETFNCDIVNRSIYSKLWGIPVAAIGLVGYLLLLVLSRINRQNRIASMILVLASLAGLGFSLYLTYVEARILVVWCILCLGSLACILTITVLAMARHARTRESLF
jgi:vitamin-K-epoxide reductase (warfarin-sensitive)